MSAPSYRALTRIAYGVAGVVLFVLMWKAVGVFGWVNPGILPDPFQLPASFMLEWQSDRLLPAIASSLIHYVWGLVLGALSGLLVGLAAATLRCFLMLQAYVVRILWP